MVAMARALEEIIRRDRRWFRAHPERWHRCRWPHPDQLDFCGGDFGSRLVIPIRHLGGGRIVYQPVILEDTLPGGERAAAALFALALRDPEPIPVVAEMNVLRLQQSGAIAQRITAAGPSLPPVAAPAARQPPGSSSRREAERRQDNLEELLRDAYEGDLTVRGRLTVHASGQVEGKICNGEIELERSVGFRGTCRAGRRPPGLCSLPRRPDSSREQFQPQKGAVVDPLRLVDRDDREVLHALLFFLRFHHLSQVEKHQTATWLRGVIQEVPAASVSAPRQFAQCEGWGTQWRQ